MVLLLLLQQILNEEITANNLQQHTGDTQAEVLQCGVDATRPSPLEQTAYGLISQHNSGDK